MLCCLVAVVLAAGGARVAGKRVVGAEAFILVDDKDRPRVMLDIGGQGPGLSIFDADGLRRVDLRARDDGLSRIELFGGLRKGGGQPVAELATPDGAPCLSLSRDVTADPQFLALAGKKGPAVMLYTNQGAEGLTAELGASGLPQFRVGGKAVQFPLEKSRPASSQPGDERKQGN